MADGNRNQFVIFFKSGSFVRVMSSIDLVQKFSVAKAAKEDQFLVATTSGDVVGMISTDIDAIVNSNVTTFNYSRAGGHPMQRPYNSERT